MARYDPFEPFEEAMVTSMSVRRPRLVLAVIALAALAGACTDRDEEPATATLAAQAATATVEGTPQPAQDIDLADPEVVGPLLDHFGGGEIDADRTEYVDYTGDSVDEAFVVVASGGTLGDLGAAVLQLVSGEVRVLGFIEAGGKVETRMSDVGGGVIASLEGVYAPTDPQCCPSQFHETVYQWDGRQFAVVIDQVIPNREATDPERR